MCDAIYEQTHGGSKLMNVTVPAPGTVGFCNVVSTSVQFSPLNPQLPLCMNV